MTERKQVEGSTLEREQARRLERGEPEDLVAALRAAKWATGAPFHHLMPRAADEIVRLRAMVAALEGEKA